MERKSEKKVSVSIHNNSFCILCCSALSSIEQDKAHDKDFVDKLMKFEEELNEIVFQSQEPRNISNAYQGISNSIKSKRITGHRSKKKYKVCENCKMLMLSAFTSKSQLDEMESHVRYLQKAILRALKVMDRQLKEFSRDLSKIGEVIRLSTDTDKISNIKFKSTSSSSHTDVSGLRECILNAVCNLDQFREETESRNINTIGNYRKTLLVSSPEQVLQDDITASQMETDSIASENHDDNWPSDHDENGDNDMNDNNISDNGGSDYEQTSRPRIRKNSKISKKSPASHESTSDKNLLKDFPSAYIGKRMSSILDEVTASMSTFKASIVRRTFNKTKRKPRRTEPACPLAYHYVTYNPDTDVLSVDNQIEIRINELDLTLHCSQCNFNCKGPEKEKYEKNGNIGCVAEKKMMYHILGKHMNVFKCEQCDKQMSGYPQYVEHRKIHQKMGSGNEPICKICGRKLKSVESFENHKWVHMTKEEKEEARRQGKKDPAEKTRNRPRIYLCQECGKGFRRPCELKAHMKTGIHREKGEEKKEKVLCGGCGIIFSQMQNLTKHLKLGRCKGIRKGEEEEGQKEMVGS